MPETNPLGQTEPEYNEESVVSSSKRNLNKRRTSSSAAKPGSCAEPRDKGRPKQSQKRARRVSSRRVLSNQMSSEASDSSDSKFVFLEFKEESCEADEQSPDSAEPKDATVQLTSLNALDNSKRSFHETAPKETRIINVTPISVGVKEESTVEDLQSESVDLNEHYGKQLADLFLGNF